MASYLLIRSTTSSQQVSDTNQPTNQKLTLQEYIVSALYLCCICIDLQCICIVFPRPVPNKFLIPTNYVRPTNQKVTLQDYIVSALYLCCICIDLKCICIVFPRPVLNKFLIPTTNQPTNRPKSHPARICSICTVFVLFVRTHGTNPPPPPRVKKVALPEYVVFALDLCCICIDLHCICVFSMYL